MRSVGSTNSDCSMSMRMKLPRVVRVRDEPLDVLVGGLLVEGEAEVRELQRDVRAQLLRGEPVEHLDVCVDDSRDARRVGDRLAEQRRVRVEAGLVQPSENGDALVERLAGDEAAGAESHPVAAAPRAAGVELSAARRIADRGRPEIAAGASPSSRAPRTRPSPTSTSA